MSTLPLPLELFYSYADADEAMCNELEKHLSLLRHEGVITAWHKRQIIAGTDWAEALDRHLNTASVILLLISANFLASDYCYGIEMQRAIQRYEAKEAYVIPILLRPVDGWKETMFGKLKGLPSNGIPITLWRNRDAAFTDVARGVRVTLEDIRRFTTVSPLPTTLPLIWNIPYPRNPVFTGREELFEQIFDLLHTKHSTALSQPQAISGLGGIGKTQLAVEYAYRYQQDYQAVLWTRADTHEALISGYVAVAELLNLSEKNKQDQTITVQAVKQWLTKHTQWLLIIDNADDLTIATEFLPLVFGGHIVLTTRAHAMGRLAHRIEIDAMEPKVGAFFLLRRTLLLAPSALLENAPAPEVATAEEICKELGGLPLALDQAGAYIEETQCSLSQYLQHYQMRRVSLLQRRGGLVTDHPESVATTWSLSFERLERQNPAAADLLRLCAYLSPDAIPEKIVTQGALHLGMPLSLVADDPLLLDEAIAVLGAYSLIRRDARDSTLSIHRLVQAVLIDGAKEASRKEWAECAVRLIATAFPSPEESKEWPLCQKLLPHVQICVEWIRQWDMTLIDAFRLLGKAGRYALTRGYYVEAESLLQYALTLSERVLEVNELDIASILNDLAEFYGHQDKYDQAEPFYLRTLAIRNQALGPKHLDVARTTRDLAVLYQYQGKYEQAEQLLLQALTIFESVLGPDHHHAATTFKALGRLYSIQGRYREAEQHLQRAITIYDRLQEQDAPDLAASLNDLGLLYWSMKMYKQAELLYRRVLPLQEQVHGPHSRPVAASLNNLALLYEDQRRYEEAELLFQQAITIWKQVLGTNHSHLASGLSNLATLYRLQEKYEEAEPLYIEATAIREQVLGPEHEEVTYSLNGLAKLYSAQERYEEAEPLFQRALTLCERALGRDHPRVAQIMQAYAEMLHKVERKPEALALEARATVIQDKQQERK